MLAKSGPFDELEGAPARFIRLLQNLRASNVAGHQVGRELDAAERHRHQIGQRVHEQRLSQARHAHEQRVAAGKDAGEQLLDDLILADDDLGQFLADAPIEFPEFIDGLDVSLLRDRPGGFFLHS